MRATASQTLLRDSGESIFAARHLDVLQGPLGSESPDSRFRIADSVPLREDSLRT